MLESKNLAWDKLNNLIPAIIQDAQTHQVLMLGYMNPDALTKTLETEWVTFYSRSKQRLWQKGETSGHRLRLVEIHQDCDQDALLILATPQGPTCHQGSISCFKTVEPSNFLPKLEAIVQSKIQENSPDSYTAKLYQQGIPRLAQKVGEEGVEVAIAAVKPDRAELAEESADLLYHLLILLQASDLNLTTVCTILEKRAHSSEYHP